MNRKYFRAAGILQDIYDGDEYQKLYKNNGPLSKWNNVSFLWNTDGAPVFKSSSFSIWPFYLTINELPYQQRISRENQILGGLWFGSAKPLMLSFLKPIHEELHRLETVGMTIDFSETENIYCRAFLYAGSCDLPAKCLVCNTIQFNGYYGCSNCLIKRVSTSAGKDHITTFPYDEACVAEKRDKTNYLQHATEAVNSNTIVSGVKGPSWLAALDNYDIIDGTGVDYMHAVLLGVVKTLLNLFFTKKFAKEPFNISDEVSKVDEAIEMVKLPSPIGRSPRSIEDNLKHFKASEFRSFLLFYGPIVLKDFLLSPYYDHFLILSDYIHILLLQKVTQEQLKHAEKLLYTFCCNVQNLYGPRFELANFHLLLHLADSVRKFGPLWTHSCFHFENCNGFLLKLIHGTQNIQCNVNDARITISGTQVFSSSRRKD